MMLKSLAVLFFVAVCSAIPIEEGQNVQEVEAPILDPQATEPQAAPGSEEGSSSGDLKTDSTYWGGYRGYGGFRGYGGHRGFGGYGGFGGGYYSSYPIQRRSSYYYRPSYYQHYPSYYPVSYWGGSYW